MKTEWDYTDLAKAYLKRPCYSGEAIDKLIELAGIESGDNVCDVGAGVAHLTLELAKRGLNVNAVEPNDEMRKYGIHLSKNINSITWFEGVGEATGQADDAFDLVTFGSSFNVTNRQKALIETKRILKPGGWFACMWNHRDLEDPVQKAIEFIISSSIEEYGYGTRREDQASEIKVSGLFDEVHYIEGSIIHTQKTDELIEAWHSHATLHRQAGATFAAIIKKIECYIKDLDVDQVKVPYRTKMWAAQLK
jgi:ubiquinone/menaquinone biosynthesis C-methylase UbiE